MRALVLLLVLAAPAIAGADWTVTRDPFDRGDIARYKALLARDPHDPALAKLAALYRSYRTLAQLEDEYRRPDWASHVVLARLYRSAGDQPGALAACLAAVGVRDDDARTWMLLGELYRAGGEPTGARAAYDAALHFARPPLAAQILELLPDLALADHDPVGADGYYAKRLALEPRNVRVGLARADMLLDAERPVEALAAYTAVEPLLAGDPARRVEVIARRGMALAKIGRDDEAVGELRRAIALGPPTRRLEAELTGRIIDLHRRRHALPELVAYYEKTWPAATRTAFEWSTLGELYDELAEDDRAIAAFARVVAMTPAEPAAHRRLIDALERVGRGDELTARLEDAARLLPREPTFQLELAQRYQGAHEDQGIATLARLVARMPDAEDVLDAVAARYTRWGRHDLAIPLYERLAVADPEYLVTIAEQYAIVGESAHVVAVFERVARRRDPGLAMKVAQVMVDYALWPEARDAYTAVIALDRGAPLAWIGRALAYEHFKDWQLAADDADHALALVTGRPSQVAALHPLQKPVSRSRARERDPQTWQRGVTAAPDPKTDYMLAEYLTVRLCQRDPTYVDCEPARVDPVREVTSNSILHGSLLRLAEVLPRDLDIRRQLAAAQHAIGDFDGEIATLQVLIRLVPAETAALEARIREARQAEAESSRATRWERILGWTDHDDVPGHVTRTRDAADAPLRIGLRAGIGGGLHGGVGGLVGIGVIGIVAAGSTSAVVSRVDWTQRGDGTDALAASAGVAHRLATTRGSIVSIGAAGRGELQWSAAMATPRVLAGDVSFDLISRHTPLGLGLRLGQEVVGGSASTATLELAVEWR